MTTARPACSFASPTRTVPNHQNHNHPREHINASSSGSQNTHTRAGACPSSSTLPSSSTSSGKAAPGTSRMTSHPRVVTAMQTPGPPQQEISEKVRDAFEDLELSQLSPVRAGSARRSHERSRSRSRGRRSDRTGDATADEKRALSERYGDTAFVHTGAAQSVQCSQSSQVAGPALASTPVRSSSLSTASFAVRPPFVSQGTDAIHLAPPPYSPHPTFPAAPPSAYPHDYSSYSSSVRRMLLVERLRPWLPFLLYGATSLGFVFAITFWKEEIFGGLDDLARWLRSEGEKGYAVMFFMIFLTCIPPLPLYSTLQVLSGYTFGAWTGSIISYFSALTGALFVFTLSRSVPSLRNAITSCMAHSRGLQRVVCAISRKPSLLFLVRLAPYPYNVLNALLAGCPRLSIRTYTVCTALSLLKVIIHTSVGAGIKSFAEYHSSPKSGNSSNAEVDEEEAHRTFIGHVSSVMGIVLCLGLAIYLSIIARRAVDEELEDDETDLEAARRSRSRSRTPYGVRADEEERAAFLASDDREGLGHDFAPVSRQMSEAMSVRLSMSSPDPISSLSSIPYGPPEWSH